MKQKLIRSLVYFLIMMFMIIGIIPIPTHAEPLLTENNQNDFLVEVYPEQHQLIVYFHGEVVKTFKVAVGNPSTPTPIGEYQIVYKGENWGPAFGPRWLGLNVPWGIYGIHGTNKPFSIGQHQSHGCIRMRNNDVIVLYRLVPIGTRVTIYGHVLGGANYEPRVLAEDDVGGDVQLIQSRLKSAGYYNGACNGKFRSDTTEALKKFQRDHHLIQNGVVTLQVYMEMGLLE